MRVNGQFLSDQYFKSCLITVNMCISIFMLQILHNIINSWILSDITRNWLLGNRKKIGKFLMRTFTYRSIFLYGFTCYEWPRLHVGVSGAQPPRGQGKQHGRPRGGWVSIFVISSMSNIISHILKHCCGSGSVGSICFWFSRIRIRIH